MGQRGKKEIERKKREFVFIFLSHFFAHVETSIFLALYSVLRLCKKLHDVCVTLILFNKKKRFYRLLKGFIYIIYDEENNNKKRA